MKRLFFIVFFCSSMHAQDVYIIVHGTWAKTLSWNMPGGDFYDTLAKTVGHPEQLVLFLKWSGKNNHYERVAAAQNLIALMYQHKPTDTFHMIGHSHGANIISIASQLLAQDTNNTYRIERLFCLGAPICYQHYLPDMSIVRYCYNLFSFADMVQPVFGMYQREYPFHSRIANISVIINNVCPFHSGLHDPIIAQWLCMIHQDLAIMKWGNFNEFTFEKPGVIHFQNNDAPQYFIDDERDEDRSIDSRRMMILRRKVEQKFDFCRE